MDESKEIVAKTQLKTSLVEMSEKMEKTSSSMTESLTFSVPNSSHQIQSIGEKILAASGVNPQEIIKKGLSG